MTKHGLTRNDLNEPVCRCGFRPEILDRSLMTLARRQLHAKNIILGHAEGLNEYEARLDALAAPVTHPDLPTAPRSPEAPFKVPEDAKYPRAGVRPSADGQWTLTLWDSPGVTHAFTNPEDRTHPDRHTAFVMGQLIIDCHWRAGTRLNGLAS